MSFQSAFKGIQSVIVFDIIWQVIPPDVGPISGEITKTMLVLFVLVVVCSEMTCIRR